MGITTDSLKRLQNFGSLEKGKKILVCGCQNIYDNSFDGVTYGMIAQDYFNNQGIKATTIDITGCNGAYVIDLREEGILKQFTEEGLFDVIANHGTFEHIDGKKGFYNAYRNIHNVCSHGGIMIHETPKTGHWIGHGQHYLTDEFYLGLAEKMGYKILDLCEHPAMGNTTDGVLVNCVLQKIETTAKDFISFEEFSKLDFRES